MQCGKGLTEAPMLMARGIAAPTSLDADCSSDVHVKLAISLWWVTAHLQKQVD